MVVDACRNNPFGGSANDDNGGLALVDAPEGALIAYSTAPGTVAFDGLGKHSPYAAAFMRTARTPNLPVEQVFKKVRLLVNESTDKKQTPWDSARLNTEFVFFANAEQPAPAVVPGEGCSCRSGLASGAVRLTRSRSPRTRRNITRSSSASMRSDPLADHVRRLSQSPQADGCVADRYPSQPSGRLCGFRAPLPQHRSWFSRLSRLQERPRQVNIAFPRRGEGRFGDGRFGIRVAVANNGRPVINLPGRGNGAGNGNGRPVIGFPQNGGNNNGAPGLQSEWWQQ